MHATSRRLGVLLGLVSTVAWGAAGDPDPTFGIGGVVTTDVSAYSEAFALVQQSDGKLVVGGQVADMPTFFVRTDALLVRYEPDGSLDATFGTGGLVRTDVVPAGPGSRFTAVLLQPGGRLVGAGTSSSFSTIGGDVVLVRYESDGSVDPSFGSGGTVVTDIAGRQDRAVAAAVQPDGRIVVVGTTRGSTSDSDLLALRYEPDGALDGTFGAGGVVQLDLSGQFDQAYDVLLAPGGRIVLAGASGTAPGVGAVPGEGVLVALDASGALDPTFGVGGVARVTPFLRSGLLSVERLASGELFAIGSGTNDGLSGFQFFARFTASGAVDLTFGGGDGIATPTAGPVAFDLARAADGDLLDIGSGFVWGYFFGALAVARYHPDGSPDSTWGNAGQAAVHVPDRWNQGAFAGLEDSATGAVVAAGFAATGPPDGNGEPRQIALARFLGVRPPCATDADCDTCERCGTAGVCENGPRTGCERPEAPGAKLVYRGPPKKARIRWKWRRTAGAAGFDGTADAAGLCMWWGATPIYESRVPAGAGWRTVAPATTFRDGGGANQGMLLIRAGRALDVKAGGRGVADNPNGWADPLLEPADQSIDLEVQLHATNGKCFAATYPHSAFTTRYPAHTRSGYGF
jgi:uncharacterized delta-60 repeat protein